MSVARASTPRRSVCPALEPSAIKSCGLGFASCIRQVVAPTVVREGLPSCTRKASAVDAGRVARLMREQGLRVKVRRRMRPTTTDSKHTHRVARNVLDRRFAPAQSEARNRVRAGRYHLHSNA
jgi:transposase InsO family protein